MQRKTASVPVLAAATLAFSQQRRSNNSQVSARITARKQQDESNFIFLPTCLPANL
jgi:hypothetical protein